MGEHYVVEQATPRWLSTGLTTTGAALITALLLWIASSQLEISTNQAVIMTKQEVQERKLDELKKSQAAQLGTLTNNQNNIWPRLRAHGENIAMLREKIEDICQCQVRLKDPEKF